MDDRLLEELCRWHDEQAAMLRSEAGNLPAAAVAADMHAKTSAALHEAADEIKRLRSGAEPGFSNFDQAGGNKPDRSIGNIPAPDDGMLLDKSPEAKPVLPESAMYWPRTT